MGNLMYSVLADKKPLSGSHRQDKDVLSHTKNGYSADGDDDARGEVVVIPVDASKEAECAFDWYIHRLHKPDNFVYVVHCEEVEHPSGKHYPDYALPREYNNGIAEAWTEKIRKAKENGQGIIDKYQQKLDSLQVTGKVHAELGRPGPFIVSMVDRCGATMVVMGTRGMGILRRTILGSVSSYVIRHSDVPVTVVPRHKPSIFF